MAGNRIQFSLDFAKGDTSALQSLKRDIAEIQKLASDIDFTADLYPNELNSMVSAAQALDKALNDAFDVDLNTLNIDKFNKSLAQSGFNAKSLQTSLNHCGITGQQAFLKATGELMKFGNTAKQTNKFLDGLATSFLNTARWSAVSSIINNISGTIQNSFSYIRGLDTSLNDIRIVTGKSADEMERFAVSANNAAKELAVSTRDYTEGSLIYYQQGLDDQTVKTLTDITAKTSNVTGQSMSEISEQLTAVWNGYQVANEAAKEGMDVYEEYVDKMAAVGAATASDLEELSVAMSKVASAASSMGVGFDDLNAQIATIVSVTRQAPESVGTALKTIYARLGDLKVDGVDEFGVSLGKIGEQMAKMGIDILDVNGDMRDMSSIMVEVAEKWDNWSSAQKQAAAIAMAGKRQYNNLVALFENWDMYSDALNTSMNAAGTLEEQQEVALDSLANKMEILKATAEDLYDSLFDSDSLKGLVDAGTAGLQLLADLADGLGGLKHILPMVGGVFLNVFNQQIGSALSTVVTNIRNTNKELDTASANARALKEMYSDDAIFNPQEGESKNEEAARVAALNDLKTYYKDIHNYQSIMTKEQKDQHNAILDAKVALGNERIELAKQEKAWSDINDELHFINGSLDENNKDIVLQINNLKRASDSIKKYSEKNNDIDTVEFLDGDFFDTLELSEEQLNAISIRFVDICAQSKTANEALDQLAIELEEVGNGASNIYIANQALNSEEEQINNVSEALKGELDLEAQIGDFSKLIGGLVQVGTGIASIVNLTKVWGDETTSTKEKVSQTMLALTMTIPMVIQGIKTISETTFAATVATEGLGAALGGVGAAIKGIVVAFLSNPVGLAIAGLAVATVAIIGVTAALDKMNKANQKAAEEAKSYAKEMSNAYTQIADTVRNARSEIENYYDAHNALGELTTGTQEWRDAVFDLNNQVTALIDKYPELAKGLEITNGVMTLNEETLENFVKELQKQQAAAGLMSSTAKSAALPKTQKADRENAAKEIDFGEKTYSLAFDQETSYSEDEKNALIKNGTFNDSAFVVKSESIALTLGQYEKLVNKAKEEGIDFLGSVEDSKETQRKIAEELESSLEIDSQTAKAIVEDDKIRTSLMQQVNKELSEEAQLQGQRNAAISQFLVANAGEKYQNLVGSDNEKDQTLLAAVNNAVSKQLESDSQAVQEELKQLNQISKEQIEKQWAEKLKYTKNDDGKYVNSSGQEVSFDLETARQQLAEVNAAEKLVEQDLGSVISGVKTAMNNLNDKYKEGLSDFLQGKGTDNLSAGLREKILEAAESDTTGDALQRLLGLSDEDLNALGYESGKTFKEALVNAINESDISLDAFKNQLSQGAKDAIDSLPSDFGAGQSNADIKQLYSNLDEASETSGVALNSLTNLFSDGSQRALDFSNAIKDIDWASFDSVNDAVRYIEHQDFALQDDTESIANYAHEMILAADAAQVLEDKLDEDVDEDEYKELAEYIEESANAIDGLSDELVGDKEAAEDLAEELLRFDSALEDVIDNYEDWEKLLESDNVQDNAKAVKELRNTYADLLDVDPNTLSEGFLSSTENLKDLKDAANGVEGAYERLAQAAAEDVLIKCGIDTTQFDADKEAIYNAIQQANIDFDTLEIGANLDVGNVYSELENIINAANMTASQAETYLAGMGIDAEVTEKPAETTTVTTSNQYWVPPRYGTETFSTGGEETQGSYSALTVEEPGHWESVTESHAEQSSPSAFALEVVSAKKSSGGNFKFNNASHGGGAAGRAARKGSGGSGGKGKKGGGGGKSGKKEEKKTKDKIDPYHDINQAIKKTSRELERLDKQEEHLANNSLIKALEKENKLLKKQSEHYSDLINLQKKEAKKQQSELRGFGFNFNEDGSIKNYSKAYKKELDKYKAALKLYNNGSQDDKAKEKLTEAEERWEHVKELVKDYEDLLNEIEENVDTKEEQRLERIANNFKIFETKIQINFDKQKMKRDWHQMTKIMTTDIKKAYKDFSVDMKQIADDIKTYYNTNTGKGSITTTVNALNKIKKSIDYIEKTGKSSKYFDTISDAQEALKQYWDELQNQAKELEELYEDAWNTYLDGIDQAQEKFDKLNDTMSDLTDQLDYQGKLIELIYGSKAYDMYAELYDGQIEAASASIEANQKMSKTYEDLFNERIKQTGHDKNDRFTWDEDEEKYYDAWQEAEKNIRDNTLEYLELIQKRREKAVEAAFDTLERDVTGGLSFEELDEDWERATKYADKYYDTVEKTYQIDLLSSKMEKEISATNNLKAQQRLNKVKEEELQKLREMDKLTEYDIKKAELRYQLEVKQIALENSRNNKKSMKLTRNSEGNWSYQYVADESDTKAKAQEVTDTWNELYELSKKSKQEADKNAYEIVKTYTKQTEELYKLYMNNEITYEEYQRRLKKLEKNRIEDINTAIAESNKYQEDLLIHTSGLALDLYKKDKTAYEGMTTEEQDLIKKLKDNNITTYGEMEKAVKEDIDGIGLESSTIVSQMDGGWSGLGETLKGIWTNKETGLEVVIPAAFEKIKKAENDYKKSFDTLNEDLKGALGKDGILGSISGIVSELGKVKTQVDTLAKEVPGQLKKAFNNVKKAKKAWKAVKEEINKAKTAVDNYLKKLDKIPKTKKTTITEEHVTKYKTVGSPSGGSGSGGSSSSGSGSSKGGSSTSTDNDNKKDNNNNKKGSLKKEGFIRKQDYYMGPGAPYGFRLYKPGGKTLVPNVVGSTAQIFREVADKWAKKNGYTSSGFKTGGYTGEWGNESGRLAMLHQKELVLNKEDTKNFLEGINLIRDMSSLNGSISNAIMQAIANMMSSLTGRTSGIISSGTESNTSQNVFNITAEFPNAENVNEIREAILSLPNLASQYINQKLL